jgi:hypothetical protein
VSSTDPAALPVLPLGGHWTDIPALVDQRVAEAQARVDAAQGGWWHLAPERHMPPGTVRTNIDGYNRTIGRLDRFRDEDRDLILYAHDDLTFLLAEIGRLRTRLAEAAAEPTRPSPGHSAIYMDGDRQVWSDYPTVPPCDDVLPMVWASQQTQSKANLAEQGIELRVVGWIK